MESTSPNLLVQKHGSFFDSVKSAGSVDDGLLHDLDNQRLTRKAGLYLCSVSPAIDQVLTSVQVSGSDQFHSALLKFGWTLDTF